MSGLTDAGITAEQLAQMQGSGPGGGMTAQDAQNMKQKQQEQEGQRQEMLTRLMAPEAKERLNRWFDDFAFEGMTARLAEMAEG